MGKLLELRITDAEYPNLSIAENGDEKICFKNGIIGQKVIVKRGKIKDGYSSGKLIDVLEDSPLQTETGCPRVKDCGGCRYQELTYDEETNYKRHIIQKLYDGLNLGKTVRFYQAPSISSYRNKMEYSFGDEVKDGPLTLGLHKKNRFYEIVDNRDCNIVNPSFDKIRIFTQEFFREREIKAYHRKRNDGELKFLIVRYSFAHNEIMLNLVTKDFEKLNDKILEEYIQKITSQPIEAKIISIFHTISNSLADAVVPEKVNHLYGKTYLKESINGLEFKISPFSFFQPNPKSAEKLYERALELAGDISNKLVYDLYCGTGTISQIFAKKASKVIGVEIVEEAVVKAEENAKINNLSNVEFIANDVLSEIENLKQKPDILVLDPPREGIHPKAIDKIISMSADTVVYISCNPKTQVRDLQLFIEAGYEVQEIDAFDQFPRTVHVETVCLLSKLNTAKHIDINLEMEELDITSSEMKASYQKIIDYILDKFGFKVSTLYIAQIKRKCGLDIGKNYNITKKDNQRIPKCPKEKEDAIIDALKHFKMI
ncbi:MAG: 23S rRNA (uracil(1939)-C(5))-methyltransferase RlmD [Tissierellia bacterium]|nr:23S rRNA (uracil(1939)-C(5))-methyltransferase RlmD [Tissierellia bacterium]